MDDFQVTSSSETPEQIQASLFEEPDTPVAPDTPEPAEPEPVAAQTEPEEDLSKYTSKQIHDNPKLRIQKATAEAAQAKREAAEARAEAQALRSRLERPVAPPEQSEGDPEPQEADFDEYKDYVRAQSRWATRQVLREESIRAQAMQRQSQIEQVKTQRISAYQDQIEKAGGQAFIDTLSPAVLNINPESPLGVAIMESEMSPRVMQYLNDNPDEIRALSGLHPIRAFREIGRIEGKLGAVAVTASAPRAVSKAKPPVRPVAGSASGGNESVEDMSFEDYFRQENAKERARTH